MSELPLDRIIELEERRKELRASLASLSDQDRALSATIARRMIARDDEEGTAELRARRREIRDQTEDVYRAVGMIADQIRELQRTGDDR